MYAVHGEIGTGVLGTIGALHPPSRIRTLLGPSWKMSERYPLPWTWLRSSIAAALAELLTGEGISRSAAQQHRAVLG